jgi:hypothetical protein
VAHFSLDRRLTRLLLAVLFGLLAMGPFLHAHVGFSKVTGFHVAGYDSTSVASATPLLTQADRLAQHTEQLTDVESAAVGVCSSLVRYVPDVHFPDALTVQTLVAVIAMPQVLRGFVGVPASHALRPSRPRPGLPPPSLAPPTLLV